MDRLLVGVDLGGTLIRAAAATGPASHGPPVHHPTPVAEGADQVLATVARAVAEATAGRTPDGVAVGMPGPLDPERGIVYEAPNLPGWRDVPVAASLAGLIGCPVVLHNDADLAGYAEWIAGAARGTVNMVFITASTGVGGGLVLDGELFNGAAGTAGEVGHMIVVIDGHPCSQGHRGCLEGIASGTAIARRAREALERGEASSLAAVDPAGIDARAVSDAAARGDALALRLYRDAGRALGLAVGGLMNLLSPEAVVIGGGLINAGDLLFGPMREALPEIAFPQPLQRCRVVPAELGTDAGLVGAVAWAVRTFGAGPDGGHASVEAR